MVTLRAFGNSAQSDALHGASLILSMYPATIAGALSFLMMFAAVTASYIVRTGSPQFGGIGSALDGGGLLGGG
jgi:hypothetical protein